MNWDLLGHEWAVALLREHILRDRLRHAYLLTGPPGIGKRTLALRLTQALNCLNPPVGGEPCRACRACLQIERMQYPDLAVVQASQRGGTLKVDQVREVQRSLSLAPYEARYRVALFLRFDEAHVSAANALLKTLEEPAPQVILILTGENAESLLPTIVSRCEILRLRPLSYDLVCVGLQQKWGVPEERARLLAHISGGRPGYALRLHQDADLLELRRVWLDDLDRLIRAGRVERFAYIEALTKERKEKGKEEKGFRLKDLLQVWLSLWRDVLLQSAGAAVPVSNLDCDDCVAALASCFELETVRRVIASIERSMDLIDRNVNPRLALDVMMLNMPRRR